MDDDSPARCFLVKQLWSAGGVGRRDVVITLPATTGFGSAIDPRERPPVEGVKIKGRPPSHVAAFRAAMG